MPMTEIELRHPQTLAARARPNTGCACVDIAPDDWDLMLSAVTARLRIQSASPQMVMLECAYALEHLHGALRHARALVKAERAEIGDGERQQCGYVFFDHLDTSP